MNKLTMKWLFLAVVTYMCLGASIAQAAYITISDGSCYDDVNHTIVSNSFCSSGGGSGGSAAGNSSITAEAC